MSSIRCVAAGPVIDNQTQASLPHILLVVDGFPKALGGGERILLRQATLLPQYGYRVSILTLFWHPESSFQPSEAPCPVYLLPLKSTYDLAALRGAWDLRHLLREQRICLAQTFFESSDLWAGGMVKLLSDAKLIWSRRDMGILRGRKHRLAYRWLRRLPDAVFAVSEEVRRHAIQADGIDPQKVRTIYNGVELPPPHAEHFPRLASETTTRVLTIGNIRFVKGHDVLIRAAATVVRSYPHVIFEIAGEVLEPEYMAHLQSLIVESGVKANVRFLGKITDLTSCLQTANLFVLPSRSEGFSNALIEAMACGVPAIATNVGGNVEAIEDGVSGLIVPADDADSLARAILRLLASPADAHRLAEAGRDTAVARFSAGAMMDMISRAYAALLG